LPPQPFEEDARDPTIFFLDHDYLETMLAMFRKVAARERVVGFYSTGPRIRPCDLAIDALVRKYCPDPVFVVVDVRRDVEGLPTQAYLSVDAVVEGRETVRTFNHVPCEVGAFEAEEVGVEHMLRDINDPSVSALGADVRAKLGGLKGLMSRLGEISSYLHKVSSGQLPPNIEALYLVQQVLALLPNLSAEPLRTSLFEVVNDQHLMLYAASLVRAVTSLHDLVANKQRVGSLLDEGGDKAKDAAKKEDAKDGGATAAAAGSGAAGAKDAKDAKGDKGDKR
jgi:26S proteasome regulatory subunit N8